MRPLTALLLLAGCAHPQLMEVGAFKLERSSYQQDLEEVGGLAIPQLRCPREEQRIEVLSVVEDEPDHAQQLRVSCGEKSMSFERCRYHVLNAIAYAWVPPGGACPPPPED